MRANRQLAPALVAFAVLATSCRGAGDQPRPAATSTAVSSTCTLAPTGGLTKVGIVAPGPGGAHAQRTYELYVPPAASAPAKLALLVSLHGTGANGSIQASITHWTSFSDSLGSSAFIAVFPDGVSTLWLWGVEKSYDVEFIFDVIAAVRTSGCVDTSRIYVDGWSEGAYMAQRMACADGDPAVDSLGIAFAGVHSYAGGDPALGGGCARLSRTPPVLMSQGLDDTIIDPAKLGFPAFKAWGTRYSCATPSQPLTAAQQLDGCAGGAQVAWWPIAGQGHLVWSCAMDPMWHNRGAWAFFTEHRAPTDSACS